LVVKIKSGFEPEEIKIWVPSSEAPFSLYLDHEQVNSAHTWPVFLLSMRP